MTSEAEPYRPSGRTVLVGTGRLARAVADGLGEPALLVDDPEELAGHPGDDWTALVSVADHPDTSARSGLLKQAVLRGLPWLPVRVDSGWVLLGPAVRPGVGGCPTCAARRRADNRADTAGRRALRERYGAEVADRPTPLLGRLVGAAVGALVRDEVHLLRRNPERARTAGALLRMAVPTGVVRRHTVLADPSCPDCGRMPVDQPDAGRLHLAPAPKVAPRVYRVASLTRRADTLTRLYVDPETGVLESVAAGTRGDGIVAVARLRPTSGHDNQHGYGRSGDFGSARVTALAEALERLAGIAPRGRRTAVRAAYADVADRALDPRTLGLHPDDRYDQRGFGYVRFDPERVTAWVWGYSFGRDEPVLVPESYAYYGPRPRHDPGFVFECSNGSALGGCLSEAILYGLLEIAERDAFLTAWYARLPLSKIDLGSVRDRRIPLLAERMAHGVGYSAMAFDATLEQGVPAFWVMAVGGAGDVADPARPALTCAAAAHPDPERALLSALCELGPGLDGLRERYRPEAAAPLVAESGLVREMDDHALLYGHPEAADRLRFLPVDEPGRPIDELAGRWSWPDRDRPPRTDLSADLADLVSRYLADDLDVIVVDTTAAEHRAGGFAAAKVLVPGTVPMTFGHHYRRTHGLPRLLAAPRRLGHRATDLAPEELNPFPHPFP
ncbi:TOMM precursor leader peptide-binding protein [Plantactinospora sp. S1510]|uniref:TOMM leader peptide-binding protein n=1 Tax=Plantactinospora alkalitolerans TaxID=2789879 RepID=A0ABS0H5T4_9ACTN|nr:TOMM precursor leader peptide-binding protein [Plantactinospora alkalitolerans]MBF9133694.1 TOMM precursor leader peptide-binding protein [Plantactinospora alkalitolerans]